MSSIYHGSASITVTDGQSSDHELHHVLDRQTTPKEADLSNLFAPSSRHRVINEGSDEIHEDVSDRPLAV
jgi:hypothetical protein